MVHSACLLTIRGIVIKVFKDMDHLSRLYSVVSLNQKTLKLSSTYRKTRANSICLDSGSTAQKSIRLYDSR